MTSMVEPNQTKSSWREALDPTDFLIKLMGIGLLIGFICPILTGGYRGGRLVFLNIEGLFEKAPFIFKFWLIYPLIAGIAIIYIAKQNRTPKRAASLIAIGLLPFLLLLANENVQQFIKESIQNIPGLDLPGWLLILSFLATLLLLAGLYAVFVKSKQTLACQLAAVGCGFHLVLLFIPNKGEFSFIAPFKLMFKRDRSGMGLNFLGGLVGLALIVIFIFLCIKCYQLLKQDRDPAVKKQDAGTALHLWFSRFYVYGAFFIYIMFAALIKSSGSRGIQTVFVLLLAIIKMFPWIMSLFLLIPLGMAEFLIMKEVPLSSKPVTTSQTESEPTPASSETPE